MTLYSLTGKMCAFLEGWLSSLVISLPERVWRRGEGMSECPDDETLAAFVDHCLRPEQRQKVEEHIADCRLCRKIVVMVFKIKKAIPEPEIPPADNR